MSGQPRPSVVQGINLAVRMLQSMQETDDERVSVADQVQVELQYQFGRPYRNLLLEFLKQAQQIGPVGEAAFCASVGHFIALSCLGFSTDPNGVAKAMRKTYIKAVLP